MDKKGFFGALLDFSFTEFITTKLIKLLYILALIGIALGALGIIIIGTTIGKFGGFLFTLLIGAPLFILFSTIMTRVWLEILVVLFRLYENVRSINEKTK